MNSTDKTAFAALIAKTWRFYGKTPTGEDVADWFELGSASDMDIDSLDLFIINVL